MIHLGGYHIEDICFFEVNTKYISSSELKISEFSRVRSSSEFFFYFILYSENQCISNLIKLVFSLKMRTRENSDVFNSLNEIYLVFTSKKQISSICFQLTR